MKAARSGARKGNSGKLMIRNRRQSSLDSHSRQRYLLHHVHQTTGELPQTFHASSDANRWWRDSRH